jgi:sugar lactone lactonase YvrE
MAALAKQEGMKQMFVPAKDSGEASLVRDLEVIPVISLTELVNHLSGVVPIPPEEPEMHKTSPGVVALDFQEVRGQEHVKRALEVAAAGGHNLLSAHPPCVSGAIICSIEVRPNLTYYVKYVTDQHCSGDLSHLRRCPTSAEVGLFLMGGKTMKNMVFLLVALLLVTACATTQSAQPTIEVVQTQIPIQPTQTLDAKPSSGWTSYPDAKYVADMAFEKDGNLWAVGAQGVFKIDPINNTLTKYTMEDGLPNNDIRSVAVAGDGALWFGTKGYGATRFDGENWNTYTIDDGLADNYVMTMATSPDGALWFGTFEYDGGVSRYDGETWITYTEDDGLAEKYVMDIAISPDGTLWFGTYTQGISKFDGETWTTYSSDDGLAYNWITSITIAPDGTLWVSTLGKGVSHFDSHSWTTYTEDDGLVNNSVNSIAVAPDESIWFATGVGVSRFDGETWTTYTKDDGLANNKVRSIIVGPDGALWFGTSNGVSRYETPE